LYQEWNFAVIADWAMDLQSFDNDTDDPDGDDKDFDGQPYTGPPLPICSGIHATFEQLDNDAGTMPSNCKALYAVQVLDSLLTAALANYTDTMADGYDDKFDTYAGSVVDVSIISQT
jgi:hypothetical protein